LAKIRKLEVDRDSAECIVFAESVGNDFEPRIFDLHSRVSQIASKAVQVINQSFFQIFQCVIAFHRSDKVKLVPFGDAVDVVLVYGGDPLVRDERQRCLGSEGSVNAIAYNLGDCGIIG
jgi:hypothetical protein